MVWSEVMEISKKSDTFLWWFLCSVVGGFCCFFCLLVCLLLVKIGSEEIVTSPR